MGRVSKYLSPILYLRKMMDTKTDSSRLEKAISRLAAELDGRVTVAVSGVQNGEGHEIDLAKIDVSVPNRAQTLEFYKVEGDEETETLVGTAQIAAGSGSYQRRTVEFRGVSLKKLRIRVSDSTGTSLWGRSVIQVFELHPWGTVVGAGKLDATRTRIFLY